ncbi:MAG: tetratricopeptide repeat protein [Nevskiaceae bacterium]|nr:MAG: tetratricopeptide repeat protein [Nevskiaceae bacterium]TBR74126.1 MAG: tetratricopeptide repeat protein [Nevskiaceae bacterium]
MTLPRRLPIVIGICATFALAGCATPDVVRNAAPPIGKTIGGQSAPDAKALPIEISKPVAADREKAIANYQALLKLNPDKAVHDEAVRRIADLQVEIEDLKGNPESGQATLADSISRYRHLLAKNPDAVGNDRLFYQLARAYDNSGDWKNAIATLDVLEVRYPNSDLMGDAHFRNAELLYRHDQFKKAAEQYHIVMDLGRDTPLYATAQYKYGWSLYKQQHYDDAIAVFFNILDHDLPKDASADPDKALENVEKDKYDIAKDALRVTSLAFTALGGGPAVNTYYKKHGEPRFYELVYNALGAMMLDQQRYTDAAKAYRAFIDGHPKHADAPRFQDKVIATYKAAGFNDKVLAATERYADDYAPDSAYWGDKAPTKEAMEHLHGDFVEIGRHYQAKAEQEKTAPSATRDADYATAAHWYQRFQNFFPVDAGAAPTSLLLGDALFDGDQTRDAAWVYEKTAYAYPGYAKAPDAALAAVQAWQKLAKTAPEAQREDALSMSIRSSKKLALVFPQHPKRDEVLAQASVDLLTLKRFDEATRVATEVLKAQPPAPPALQRTTLGVVGDARFAQSNYPDAEHAYTKLLALAPAGDKEHPHVVSQLALSIYRQGEAQQKLGNWRVAAENYLRVGKVVPEAELHPTADYNAAAAFIQLKDWPRAEQTLESFRQQFPDNKLIPDVDKKLAVSYQTDGKLALAAAAYMRISQRTTESVDTRREAAWLAAQLYDQAPDAAHADTAYQSYVSQYPLPLDRAMDARARLTKLALARHDEAAYEHWLEEIISADARAGAARNEKSRVLASHASLILARKSAEQEKAIALAQPLKDSLTRKTAAMQATVQKLQRTLGYGIAEDTTAATFELGALYEDFANALMHSQRPALGGDELAQYNLLLQEKADPLFDQAIKAHEANLAHVGQGVYDKWVAQSVAALARLAPGLYAKHEKSEASYDHLH